MSSRMMVRAGLKACAVLCVVSAAGQEAGDPATWPVVAGDPALTRFVSEVVAANPRVQAARAALNAGTALAAAAGRPLYNPELELEAENGDVNTRSLGIAQTFDWSDKRGARGAVAAAERRIAETEYRHVRWQIMVDLLQGLAAVETALQRDALARERVGVMNRLADVSQRRFEAGDLNRIEFDLAVLAHTDARIRHATVAADLADARQVIANLTPAAASADLPRLAIDLPRITWAAGDASRYVADLPEVRAAELRVEAAAGTVELRRRERWLDPTVGVRGGSEGGDALIGLSVSIPLPLRNRFAHEVTAADADRDALERTAEDIRRRAQARIVGATDRYRLAREAWSVWGEAGERVSARRTDELQRLWEAGEISTTDYLVQLNQTIDTREDAFLLRERLWRAWFEWLHATGEIEAWLALP